ncbi:MAG: hypothetical protein ACRDKZ_11010 [Actinomycetota bacterium]
MTEREPDDERVTERASKLQMDESDDDELSDPAVAERAARRMIEDSEGRSEQASESTPADDSVIKRTSEETATDPD